MKKLEGMSGVSLLSVMVATGILSIFVYTLSTVINNVQTSSRIVRDMSNQENLRNHLRLRADCGKTFTKVGAKCDGQEAPVLTPNDAEVISIKDPKTGHTIIGDYAVSSRCASITDSKERKVHLIQVEYSHRIRKEPFKPLFKEIQLCELVITE